MSDPDNVLPMLGLVVEVDIYNEPKRRCFRKQWNRNAWRWIDDLTGEQINQGDVMDWKFISPKGEGNV